jgi:hypothetical protein
MGRRSEFDASFKAKVALEVLKGQKNLNELAKKLNVDKFINEIANIAKINKNIFSRFLRTNLRITVV